MAKRAKKLQSLTLKQKLQIINTIERNPLKKKSLIAEELQVAASGKEDFSRKRKRAVRLKMLMKTLCNDLQPQGRT